MGHTITNGGRVIIQLLFGKFERQNRGQTNFSNNWRKLKKVSSIKKYCVFYFHLEDQNENLEKKWNIRKFNFGREWKNRWTELQCLKANKHNQAHFGGATNLPAAKITCGGKVESIKIILGSNLNNFNLLNFAVLDPYSTKTRIVVKIVRKLGSLG